MQTCDIDSVKIIKDNKTLEDITAGIISIGIQEDLNSKILKGIIQFRDETKLFNKLYFNGTEFVEVKLYNNIDKKNDFFTFTITGHTIDNNASEAFNIITLDIAEPSYVYFIKEFSTSFSSFLTQTEKDSGLTSLTITDFIKRFSENVLLKTLRNEHIEPSKDEFSFSFPYQKFHYILSYLNQYLESVNGYHNYFYFTRLFHGTFLTTLQNLVSKDIQNYNYISQMTKNENAITTNAFSDYKIISTPNMQNLLLSKQGSSRVQSYNYAIGIAVQKDVRYSEIVKNQKLTNDWSILSKNILDDPMYTYYASTANYKNEAMVEQSLFNYNCEVIQIVVDGIIQRGAGDVFGINFIEQVGNDESDSFNSGKMIAQKIMHLFTHQSYTQEITLINNGKRVPMNVNDQPASK